MEKRAIKLLALKEIKGYGNKKIIDLIRASGSVDNAYNDFLSNSLINEGNLIKYENVLKLCRENNIKIITYFDDIYPNNLKKISSPPLVLFAKGDLGLLKMPSISIVGTRSSSDRSLNWTYNVSKEIANLGYVVISGGALGIDTEAHKGVLGATGNTICVLGSGLINVYPKENISLFENISKKGLILSEYAPGRHVSRISLLERNRITSGLGDKLLVIATKLQGGAMSQYKVALSQGKKIFCPNPVLELEPTEGIKQIIQNNKKITIINNIKEMLDCSEDCSTQKVLETFA